LLVLGSRGEPPSPFGLTEPLREIDEWLAPYRAAWAGRLGALESHLDDMDN
jgi:hypothetical protein